MVFVFVWIRLLVGVVFVWIRLLTINQQNGMMLLNLIDAPSCMFVEKTCFDIL